DGAVDADAVATDGPSVGVVRLWVEGTAIVESGRLVCAGEPGGASRIAAARSPRAASAPVTTPSSTNLTPAGSRRPNYYTACGMSEHTGAPAAEPVEASESPSKEPPSHLPVGAAGG